MEITAIENYIVDTNNLTIPDKGLGNYKCGFTEERKPFNLQNIWLNLLPFFGQILGQRRNSVAGLSKIDRQTVGFLIRIS